MLIFCYLDSSKLAVAAHLHRGTLIRAVDLSFPLCFIVVSLVLFVFLLLLVLQSVDRCCSLVRDSPTFCLMQVLHPHAVCLNVFL